MEPVHNGQPAGAPEDAAIHALDEVVQRYGERDELEIREQVAGAMLARANLLPWSSRPDQREAREAKVRAYDAVVARFGDCEEPALARCVAAALLGKGDTLVKLAPTSRDDARAEAGRPDAIAAYEEVVRRFGAREEQALQLLVARALFGKGAALDHLRRYPEAQAAYEELLERMGEPVELESRALVAAALCQAGKYTEVVRRFGARPELELAVHVAEALLRKANGLYSADRHDKAIAVLDELVRRFGERTESALASRVDSALMFMALIYGQYGPSGKALAAYDEQVRRYDERENPGEGEVSFMMKALIDKGSILRQLGRSADAIATYDELVRRLDKERRWPLVRLGLTRKALTLREFGFPEAAVQVCYEIIRRYGEKGILLELRDLMLGYVPAPEDPLERTRRLEAELHLWEQWVQQHGRREERPYPGLTAEKLLGMGRVLEELGRPAEAIDAFDMLIWRVNAPVKYVARAFIGKGHVLERMSRLGEAAEAYGEVGRRFIEDVDPQLCLEVAIALRMQADALAELGRTTEAIDACDKLVRHLGARDVPRLREQVRKAILAKTRLLHPSPSP